MIKLRLALLLFIIALCCACSTPPIANGGSSQQGNGIVAGIAHTADGLPAFGATVRLRRSDYVSQPPASLAKSAIYGADALTDEAGRFEIKGIDSGSYSIEVSDSGSAVLFRCSLDTRDTVNLGTDTLRPFGVIKGMTDTSGTSGKRLFVQVRGIEHLASVDPAGTFWINDLPAGLFTLHIIAVKAGQTTEVATGQVTVISGDTAEFTMPGWKFSKRLFLNTTASGADVAGTVRNFPVLVRLSSGNFNFSDAKSGGEDVRFTKSNGTPLPFEIERWDSAAGAAEIWVKVDTVFGNDSAQYVTMFWGLRSTVDSTGSPQGSATVSLSNGASVFDTAHGFQGVWHLGQAGGTAANDATKNRFDGTPFYMTTASKTAGAIGNAQVFDGQSSYIQMNGTASGKLNFPRNGTYSISAWVNTDTLDKYFHTIASKGDYQYNLEIVPTDEWEFAEYNDGTGWDMATFPGQAKTWTFLTGVRAGDKEYLYVNGELADTTIFLNVSTIQRYTGFDFMIGRNRDPAVDTTGFFFNGMIDEVRIASVAPNADWIKLCYMNQKAGDALVVFRP